MAQNKRQELLSFLDRKAFDPVLKASPDRYQGEADRRALEHVKRSTKSEKKRYHENYGNAEEIRKRFLDDLDSEAAKKVDSELRRLDLPCLPELKDEFLQLCDSLGVGKHAA